MIINSLIQGRLGNNIFQYIAIKVIQKYVKELGIECNYEYGKKYNMFSEFKYKELYSLLKEASKDNEKKHFLKGFLQNNFTFDGFYQFDYHIKDNLSYIRELFTEDNEERINDTYRVSDIVKGINNYDIKFDTNDIVTHVRLDDFLNGGIVMDHKYISKIINDLQNKGKVYVICDKIKTPFEIKYMKDFKEDVNYNLISSEDMFKDLAYLWKAPNLICNNSTFCWIAAIFGDHKMVWFPKNLGLNPPQHFEKIRNEDIIYEWNILIQNNLI